jgi:hypothetical protein
MTLSGAADMLPLRAPLPRRALRSVCSPREDEGM